MEALAVVIAEPGRLDVREVGVRGPGPDDVVVDVEWTGVSAGTERLLWTGRMPSFPGLGYPLVPGYEAVGTVVHAGPGSGRAEGDRVFVPGANCYTDVRGLFGASASTLVVPGARILPLAADAGAEGCLLALAATAYHALESAERTPELIVGHGAFGRLLARLIRGTTGAPVTVWELDPRRREGGDAWGYRVVHPDEDDRTDYASIVDASGAGGILDTLVERLGRGGEVILAGFYDQPVSFRFPPAFMREARFRVAAEWRPADLVAVGALVLDGHLSLDDLVTHGLPAANAAEAYHQAFDDPDCVKMTLHWSADR